MKQQALAYTFLIMFALSIIFTGVIIYNGWHVFQAWSPIAITIIIVSLCVAVPLGILLAFGFGFARLYRHLLHTHIFQQEHATFFNPFTKSFVQPDRYEKRAAQITSTKIDEVDTPALPGAASFRDVMQYIHGDQVVLGVGAQGAVSGEVTDWLSTLVAGRPGMGKTTVLYFFIAQLMMLGARFQVLDPHATMLKLKNLLPYVHKIDACIAMAPVIEQELEGRIERFEANDSECHDPHYMLIVDELPAISQREEQLSKQGIKFRSLIDVLQRVVCEGRKYKMYATVVGQSIPASILPTIARANMSSRYVFNCVPSHARMAGLEDKEIKTMLPLLKNAVGKCIISPARMDPFLGAIPNTTIDDLRYVVETTGYVKDDVETLVNDSVNTTKALEYELEKDDVNVYAFPKKGIFEDGMDFSKSVSSVNDLPEGIDEWTLRQIEQMWKAKWSLRDICKQVGMSGRNYHKFQEACRYLGIV